MGKNWIDNILKVTLDEIKELDTLPTKAEIKRLAHKYISEIYDENDTNKILADLYRVYLNLASGIKESFIPDENNSTLSVSQITAKSKKAKEAKEAISDKNTNITVKSDTYITVKDIVI
ncbi:MAG: hypothetical protein ACLVKO_01345 [Dysgonomonas sp.]